MAQTVIAAIAGALDARTRCLHGKHPARVMDGGRDVTAEHYAEWAEKHEETAEQLTREYLPSGGGFDSGTTLDLERSREDWIVFQTSVHHMDEHGSYDGWTKHTVTVRPSLVHGIVLTISGRNRNDIKDHLYETFHHALTQEIETGGAK